MLLYFFDLNFAKVLDFFLLICGTLLLHWTWEVTSPHFLDPWCSFSRLHQPKVPARAPCQAWCLEANGKFGAVWRLYVNCVWWKIDFCAKKSAALNLSISEIVVLFKGLRVKFVIFELVFLLRWRRVQLFNLFWSHWHRSCSHHWKLFLQQLRWANPNLRTTTTSLPTTCPRTHKKEKTNWQQKTTTKRRHQKKMNIWTSPSSGMDFSRSDLRPPCDCIALKRKQTIVFPFHPRKGREFLANRPGPREFCQQEEWHFLKKKRPVHSSEIGKDPWSSVFASRSAWRQVRKCSSPNEAGTEPTITDGSKRCNSHGARWANSFLLDTSSSTCDSYRACP